MSSIKAEPDSLSYLNDNEIQFLLQQTGIRAEEELDAHLKRMRDDAYAVFPHTCVQCFDFAKLKIINQPAYAEAVRLGRERPGALFLEVGCGCGIDTRKVVVDGWPVPQVVASDLHAGFWEVGHKLFKTTPAAFPAKFMAGDAMDRSFLAPGPIAVATKHSTTDVPVLSDLTTLTTLHGRFSAIFSYSFFHLFDAAGQEQIAQGLASLLSPETGSVIFGSHIAMEQEGERTELRTNGSVHKFYCHSPKTWSELWQGIFGPTEVRVASRLVERKVVKDALNPKDGRTYLFLEWSVTRI